MRPLLFHFILFAVLLPTRAAAQESKPKLPMPSREALDQSEQVVRTLHAAEFAKTTAAARLELAKKLLQQGAEIDDSPADRFALWRQSATLAILAGDVPQAWKAVDELGKVFAGSPWELKAAILEAGASKGTAAEAGKFAHAALAAFDQAKKLEPDSAGRLLDVARISAQKAKDKTALALIEVAREGFRQGASRARRGQTDA